MYKLICITKENTADGFRLAGIDVVEAETDLDARACIVELLQEGEAGIIALDQRLIGALDERLERQLERVYRPVLVTLPLGDTAQTSELTRQRLQRLIRRAVGFDVTLKRGD